MSNPSTPLPPGVVAIPPNRPAFAPGQKHSYYVSILVSPNAVLPPPPVTATPPPARIHPCQVDTGSCGLVVPESLFYVDGLVGGTLLPGVEKGDAVTVLYQPSKNDLQGFYYKVAELGLGVDSTGACAAMCRNVTVVGASGVQNSEGMLGIGFGRPHQYGDNLFLNAAGVYPSYLLTTDGIWLGYNQSTLPGSAWGFQHLQQLPQATQNQIGPPDWTTPKATITVGANTVQGGALLDTGVVLMMMGLNVTGWDGSLPNQPVTITWPGDANQPPILSYTFTIGAPTQVPTGKTSTPGYLVQGTAPMSPAYFISLGVKASSFVNTGINVIAGANFFFDAKVGQIGFLSLGD